MLEGNDDRIGLDWDPVSHSLGKSWWWGLGDATRTGQFPKRCGADPEPHGVTDGDRATRRRYREVQLEERALNALARIAIRQRGELLLNELNQPVAPDHEESDDVTSRVRVAQERALVARTKPTGAGAHHPLDRLGRQTRCGAFGARRELGGRGRRTNQRR